MSKKLLLSFFVVISFISYAILQSVNKVSGFFGEAKEPQPDQQPQDSSSAPVNNNQATVAPAADNQSAGQPTASAGAKHPIATAQAAAIAAGNYKDGQYVGDSVDVYYGRVQVKAYVQAGKITDVQFLNYPQDQQTSQEIAARSLPVLRTEAITAQSASVDMVSGATETSRGFILSLQSALAKAQS